MGARPGVDRVTKREEQRQQTYARIVDAAVGLLVDNGYAATTALGVQERAGISRGALLHHFPTSEDLFAAAVQRLVEMNIEAIHDELARADQDLDPVARGVHVLYRASRRRSFATELELWAAARADVWLRQALLPHERAAAAGLRQVMDELFGPLVAGEAGYRALVDITIHLLRGITVSASLGSKDHDAIVDSWISVIRQTLDSTAATTNPSPGKRKRPSTKTDQRARTRR
ncbi:TetR/AcrR family transcriptional regulator [Mycobacterium sp. pR1184]|uniref:TetR/AcrR family transcriptional regulator n=1 Tax=Mycobacterium sp. pR1184 TaxID=3238981 RepID=UPI00351B7F37